MSAKLAIATSHGSRVNGGRFLNDSQSLSTGCPTLMLKAWDQADIDVDLGYCRGTAVLRRVALKSEGSRRGAAGLRPITPAKKPALRFCGEDATELQNCRNGFSAGGASCSDFECGARLRASPRGLVRARRLSPGTTRVRGLRYRHPSPRAREGVGRRPFQPARKRWRFSWNSYVLV